MNIQPIQDRIVVLPLEASDCTPSGLYIPEAAKKRARTGTVIAAGPGKQLDNGSICPLTVKVGDEVAFGVYTTEIELEGKTYYILREDEILGIITSKEETN